VSGTSLACKTRTRLEQALSHLQHALLQTQHTCISWCATPRRRVSGRTAMLVSIANGVPGCTAAAVAMLGLACMSDTLTTPTAFCGSCVASV
jgi:hypothetical protein